MDLCSDEIYVLMDLCSDVQYEAASSVHDPGNQQENWGWGHGGGGEM